MLQDRSIPFRRLKTQDSTCEPNKTQSPCNISSSNFKTKFCRISKGLNETLDWKNYYDLHMIYTWMSELERRYPSICTTIVFGKTVEGRKLMMMKISNSLANNIGVWVDGCIHAREWISASVVTYLTNYLATNFHSLPSSIKNKDWFLVPVLNPDGYVHTHTVDRLWRKNRARINDCIVGVDLNRNFGYYFGRNNANDHVSIDPMNANFCGPHPFSEPECSAVKDFILYSGSQFKVFITCHSYGEAIAFPWCYTTEACPNYVSLLEGGALMAKAIYDTTGHMYKVGNFKDIMYYASGTSIDWSYSVAKIPFSYLIELRSKEYKFLLPKEEILDCCKEFVCSMLVLAEHVDKKC